MNQNYLEADVELPEVEKMEIPEPLVEEEDEVELLDELDEI